MKYWTGMAGGVLASLLFWALIVWAVTSMIPDCAMYLVTETRDGKEVTHLECRQ